MKAIRLNRGVNPDWPYSKFCSHFWWELSNWGSVLEKEGLWHQPHAVVGDPIHIFNEIIGYWDLCDKNFSLGEVVCLCNRGLVSMGYSLVYE